MLGKMCAMGLGDTGRPVSAQHLHLHIPRTVRGKQLNNATMKKEIIPHDIQRKIEQIIDEFNKEELDLINDFYKYIAEFKGKYIYLKIMKYESISQAGRLTFSGDINNLEFEMFFPGVQYLDGTVNGALYACNTAYPPM